MASDSQANLRPGYHHVAKYEIGRWGEVVNALTRNDGPANCVHVNDRIPDGLAPVAPQPTLPPRRHPFLAVGGPFLP